MARDFQGLDITTWLNSDDNSIMYNLSVEPSDLVYTPLDWQKQGLQQTASGYGRKLTMPHKVSFNGKLYRLYCTIFSNAGSVWFTAKGNKIFVS